MIPSVLVQHLRETVLDYLRTTFDPSDDEFEDRLVEFLDGPDGLFKGPYVDIRLPFRRTARDAWVPLEFAPTFQPYSHQVEAFGRLSSLGDRTPRHTLVSTGTGSGKTECFLFPVLDHCLRHSGEPGIKAILLYPMNALANDQARRIAKMLWTDERLKGRVSAGLYVGGIGHHGVSGPNGLIDSRDILRDSPPDILLTNYKMLDFLLMRPEDRRLWRGNAPDTLRYLILDELHTYDGAQGTDVACLIRRLKARLAIPTETLCCVGTSATLGARSGDEAARSLVEFASRIFGEAIDSDAVIAERRLGIREALGDRPDIDRFPTQEQAPDLIAALGKDPSEWLVRQARMWCGDEAGDLDPVALGYRLGRHAFLRELLQVLDGGVCSWQALSAGVARIEPRFGRLDSATRDLCLQSFIALVSRARRAAPTEDDPARTEPFLTVQVHLWLRELRRLLLRIGPTSCGYYAKHALDASPNTARLSDMDELPSFVWADQMPGKRNPTDAAVSGLPLTAGPFSGAHWAPMAWCRECGIFGVAGFEPVGSSKLETDPGDTGRMWLDRRPQALFLLLGSAPDGEKQEYLCPACLRLSAVDRCSCNPGPPVIGLPVRVSRDVSEHEGNRPPRFLARCPSCASNRSLTLLGSRAPSLLSVMLSHYYASEYNEDRKLLAFTDSVQDASHRAGFFGSRTYRFNLRRAIQVMLESTEEEPLLTEAAESVTRFWRPDVGVEKLVATLMPPDLREYPGYQAFLSSSKNEVPPALLQGLLTRLSWEIVMEYGHAVRVGRTLETTLCSTARFDSAQIDRVARELKLDIEEQDLLGPPSRVVSEENVRHWLWGLLRRWRVRGGITHPLLGRYLRAGADRFQLSKYAEPLLSPFGPGSVLPVFITDRGIEPGHRALESVVVSGERHGWYRDWAIRALSPMLTVDSLTELHRIALRRLANVGILENRQNQQVSTWGIRPEALRLTKHVTELLCTMCRRHYTVTKDEREILIDKRCPQYRCGGHLADAPIEPNTYYANYYRSGRLERIFPREHTGMLSRKQREEIEERFKQGTSPDGPNLIVCTPTLEMGIDVGDLSATMLCSVPPSTANFLQRIGRAGRRTGNALCLTMAVSRPHDLYFQAEPMEMLSGAVLPPGCFLDAPEILKRQFVAYAMDAWAAHEGDDVKIPRNCAMVLTEAGWAAFPGRFLEFYKREQSRLLDSFLEMFGSGLSPANLERIRQYGVSTEVTEAITDAFETVRRERDELRSMYKRANRRHAEIGRNPESADDPEVDKNELGEALAVIRRLIEELGNKYTLNVLTDEGVIPNYAFPEPGVYLDSVIRIERPNAAIKHRTYTFLRPASSAIREFAPFNSFYADGRKVRIDEVDLGTRDRSRLEDWRFCPACNHMELVGEQRDTAEGCPRCKTDGWTDAGQVRTLVNFRRARSLTGSPTAAVTDDSDDREEQYYELQELIDVGPENLCGARAIKSLPFGVELLRDLRMRQVNFGMAGPAIGGGMEVAGQNLSASGFEVCAFCGRVRGANGRIDGASQIRHLPQCRSRRPGMKEKTRTIHLYRQIASEAIRILLPVSQVGHDAATASFQAALQLGFRRHFQGAPGHLLVRAQQEPLPDETGHRRFLIVFDAVPGGTGYLSELWQGDTFFRVLEGALRALVVCDCRKDPTKDGCYRCLYAYQEQRNLEIISSRLAERMLKEILDKEGELAEVGTLSDLPMDILLESELERRFLSLLLNRIAEIPRASWKQVVSHGQACYRISLPIELPGKGTQDIVWDIVPQENLGPREGVDVPCRPDFIFKPRLPQNLREGVSTRPLPLAVFCDGLAYHVKPDQPLGGIADDIRKRTSLLHSHHFHVWSLTWKDVEGFASGSDALPQTAIFGRVPLTGVNQLWEMTSSRRTAVPSWPKREAGRLGSMEMLIEYLRNPWDEAWRDLARCYLLQWVSAGPLLSVEAARRAEERLELEPRRFTLPVDSPGSATGPGRPDTISRADVQGWLAALVRADSRGLSEGDLGAVWCLLRLFDEAEGRSAPEFETSWRSFLQAWNLVQFHDGVRVVSSECPPDVYEEAFAPTEAPLAAESAVGPVADAGPNSEDAYESLLELATAASRALLLALRGRCLPAPQFDFELPGDPGRCGPQADLAWPELLVAILSEQQLEDQGAFERAGFLVWSHPVDVTAVTDELARRSTNPPASSSNGKESR